jgi:hypothetical protein
MLLPSPWAACTILAWLWAATTLAGDAKPSTYAENLRLLKAHTTVLELTDGPARVAVCPQWQGRVLIATCEGPQGASFGWVNRAFVEAGKPSPVFNNYGGLDRFWISPEAGQFAIFFPVAAQQKLANWITPPGLNEGAFEVTDSSAGSCRLTRRLELTNYAGTKFNFEVHRTVSLLRPQDYAKSFGPAAARQLEDKSLRRVGVATQNTIVNRGPRMSRDTGLVSIWTLGQFEPGDHTVIIVPYRSGSDVELGPPVTPDYFGPVPPERLRVTEQAILFLGDGKFRAKLGVSPARSKGVAGSYDFDKNILTLVSFSLPADAVNRMYANNRWELPQRDPYRGDAFNSYNDGPAEPGAETLGGFYELETLSPTLELATGETLVHVHRTVVVRGDEQALAAAAKAVLGVELDQVKAAMFR